MQLVLVLPALLAHDVAVGAPAPALAHLLDAAPTKEAQGIGAALAPHYGVARQTDWPLAAVRLAALDVDPGSAYWLAADPITLVAAHDDVRFGGTVHDLSPTEAAALVDTLNAHFAADGIAFVAPRPDAWFVRARNAPALATTPVEALADRPLREALPEGPDARTWRRWQNEIQMLLSEHPVNVARMDAGRASVNSVWFSDGGTLPPRDAIAAPVATWTNGGIAAALAAHVGARARPVPAALEPILAENRSGTIVVVPERALDNLERAWASPAVRALRRGTLADVQVIANGVGHAAVWSARADTLGRRIAGMFQRRDLAALLAAARD